MPEHQGDLSASQFLKRLRELLGKAVEEAGNPYRLSREAGMSLATIRSILDESREQKHEDYRQLPVGQLVLLENYLTSKLGDSLSTLFMHRDRLIERVAHSRRVRFVLGARPESSVHKGLSRDRIDISRRDVIAMQHIIQALNETGIKYTFSVEDAVWEKDGHSVYKPANKAYQTLKRKLDTKNGAVIVLGTPIVNPASELALADIVVGDSAHAFSQPASLDLFFCWGGRDPRLGCKSHFVNRPSRLNKLQTKVSGLSSDAIRDLKEDEWLAGLGLNRKFHNILRMKKSAWESQGIVAVKMAGPGSYPLINVAGCTGPATEAAAAEIKNIPVPFDGRYLYRIPVDVMRDKSRSKVIERRWETKDPECWELVRLPQTVGF